MKRPILIGSIPVFSLDSLERKIKDSEGICDLVELRLDYMREVDPKILELLKPFAGRCILTLRSRDEVGINHFPDDIREAFLSKAVRDGFMVDVELVTSLRTGIKPFISSMHFLGKLPERSALSGLLEKARGMSKHVKIAYVPSHGSRSSMLHILEESENLSIMEIGGSPESRIAFSLLGSEMIYCHLGDPTASGQMECSRAVKIIDCIWRSL